MSLGIELVLKDEYRLNLVELVLFKDPTRITLELGRLRFRSG